MNATQIETTYNTALRFLSNFNLKNAFDKCKILINEAQLGEFRDKCDNLEQNYKLLLSFFVSGTKDPERETIYRKLIARLFVLLSDVKEELLVQNSTNFEYSQKRYFPYMRNHKTATAIYNALSYYHKQTSLLLETAQLHEVEWKRLRSNYEATLGELFNLFWLTTNFDDDEKNLFQKILEANYEGSVEKSLIVSALTLNLWRKFDENKLMMLFDSAQCENSHARQRALVGLCFILAKYNTFLPYFPSVRNRLVLMTDDHHLVENFQNIIIQIIGTTETEKISKKLHEEILPEVMKLNPLLKDKMDAENFLNSDEWMEENPEWQEILQQSGLSDKLQELSDLQLEGADVYMSTFSMLKSFPFFSEFYHWFLPFDPENSAISELFKEEEKTLLSAFVNSNIMCNSDKYSFCLSILQMPESQRNILKQSFKLESNQLEEMEKETALLSPETVEKNISKQYIQDLFRFFKLHPQHNDFEDMFATSLSLHRTYLFEILATDSNFKLNIAEYYFSKGYFRQALDLFEQLQSEIQPSASLYQKMGYSYQQTSQLQKALDAYLKADMIQPDDEWTIRKIALCYRLLGNQEKALQFYQYADFLNPNQYTIQRHIAQCYVELGKYQEALNIYYKLDAENGDDIKIWRAISWCSFVMGDLKKAEYYSKKILAATPIAYDFINGGHIAWSQGKISKALEFYCKGLNLLQNNWEVFQDTFFENKSHLLARGIKENEIPLMLDEILYNEGI